MIKIGVIVFAALVCHSSAFYGLEEVQVTVQHETSEVSTRGVITLAYHTTRIIVWLCPEENLGPFVLAAKSAQLQVLGKRALVFPYAQTHPNYEMERSEGGFTTYTFTINQNVKLTIQYLSISDHNFQNLILHNFHSMVGRLDLPHEVIMVGGADEYYDSFCKNLAHKEDL